jgi:5-methylcytosine-specific restriction endonuclease McrA
MNFYEQERIQEIRRNKLVEQKGRCAACNKLFKNGDKMELAHIIPQRLWIIKMYGKAVIHHPMNMKATHAGACNSAVQMSPNKSELMMKHVQAIEEKIKHDETIQQVMDRR